MWSDLPPGKGRLSEPFAWIILGAVLVFASSIATGAVSLVILAMEFSVFAPPWELPLSFISLALGFLSPVGSFLLLVGLARATRPPRFPAPQSAASDGRDASEADSVHPANPFRIAVTGAALSLIGGLAVASTNVARFVLSPFLPHTTFQEYFLTWTLMTFLTAAVASVGSLIAFVGVGLMVRNASRRAELV